MKNPQGRYCSPLCWRVYAPRSSLCAGGLASGSPGQQGTGDWRFASFGPCCSNQYQGQNATALPYVPEERLVKLSQVDCCLEICGKSIWKNVWNNSMILILKEGWQLNVKFVDHFNHWSSVEVTAIQDIIYCSPWPQKAKLVWHCASRF